MEVTRNLASLLDEAAEKHTGIILYSTEDNPPEVLSYRGLRSEASRKASQLRRHYGVSSHQIVLVHFHSHRENIVWFWACVLAKCVPAMSTPFINNKEGRMVHLAHLHRLLLDPLVITSKELLSRDFADNTLLRCVAAEDIDILDEEIAEALEGSETEEISSPARHPTHHSNSWSHDLLSTNAHLAWDMESAKQDSNSSIVKIAVPQEDALPVSDSVDPSDDTSVWYESFPSPPRSEAGFSDISLETNTTSGRSSQSPMMGEHTGDMDTLSCESIEHDYAKGLHTVDHTSFVSQIAASASLTGVAALMLTSGSTGSAKAVCLRHAQILTACRGKLSHMPITSDATILNWIGLDHVGSLTELHLTAMLAGCDQVHVPTGEVIADPFVFLRLLSKHRVARTFAPNFMMAKLLQLLDQGPGKSLDEIDLGPLLYLISGGEPNSVDVCNRISVHLQRLGARTRNTITPGFGMTETCAGSIYSRNCPDIDLYAGTEFTALGTCVPGIEMRVSDGELQVQGPIVFDGYFNNAEATSSAFTDDGWFKTGDTATVDDSGVLRLIGRSKDLVNINGIKYLSHELETAIDQAKIPGVALSHVVCFAHRPSGATTEHVQVVYQRDYDEEDKEQRMSALHLIIRSILFFTGARPRVLPLSPGRLERTTLGKLSRSKIMAALNKGDYQVDEEVDFEMLRCYQHRNFNAPANAQEGKLMGVFRDCQLGAPGMDIDSPILDTGVTSVDLIRFKRATEKAFSIPEIPIITIMTNTTIRELTAAIEKLARPKEKEAYNPIITLQPHGDKTPLFLLHPGIGEMLVFLGLVQYFPDRPIYAMRARGLNEGEESFESQEEVVSTYHQALKEKQPHGPYAIAGYSYGSMLAFEIAKRLEADGDRVQFLASFNLPPHIKTRMRKLDWTAGMVHIAHFCSIISEQRSEDLLHELRDLPHDEQVTRLLAESDQQRCADLALTHAGLLNWVDVSWSLQKIGWNYEPSGDVSNMDIFYCQPLKDVASNRVEYRRNHLNHWVNFIRNDLSFHEVEGQHYTMIDQDHCPKFQKVLKEALAARGL